MINSFKRLVAALISIASTLPSLHPSPLIVISSVIQIETQSPGGTRLVQVGSEKYAGIRA